MYSETSIDAPIKYLFNIKYEWKGREINLKGIDLYFIEIDLPLGEIAQFGIAREKARSAVGTLRASGLHLLQNMRRMGDEFKVGTTRT